MAKNNTNVYISFTVGGGKPAVNRLQFMNKYIEKADGASIPAPFYVVADDGDFTILYANEHFFSLLKWTQDEIIGKYGGRLSALLNPDDFRNMREELKKYGYASGSLRFRKKDGSAIWTDTSLTMIDEKRIYCVSQDVTRYREKLSEINGLEHKCGMVMSKAKCLIFEYFPMYKKAEYYMPQAENKKIAVENFPDSLTAAGNIHPDFVLDFTEAVNDMAAGSSSAVCEIMAKGPHEKEYKWYALTMERTFYDGGHHIVGVMEDITDRKETAYTYLADTRNYQALLSDTEAWLEANISRNRIDKTGGLWNEYNGLTGNTTYDNFMKNFVKKSVHPSERNRYIAVMESKNLISSYKNGVSKLGCEFRYAYKHNKSVWMRITAHIFPDPADGSLNASLFLINIDGENKKELRLNRAGAYALKDKNRAEYIGSVLKAEGDESLKIFNFDRLLGREGDMAYIIDVDTYELLEGNESFYNRIGISEQESKGMKCYEAIHKRNEPCPFCSKLNWSEEKFYIWKNYNAVLEQEFIIKSKLMRHNGRNAMLAVLIDISGNKIITDFTDSDANAENALLNCTYKIMEADSLETAINTALEATAHFYGAERVQLWEKSAPDGEFVLSCEYAKDPDAPLPVSYERTVSGFLKETAGGIWAETQENMLFRSFDMYKLMKNMYISNYRVSPIADKKETYGCIVIESAHIRCGYTYFIESLCLFLIKEIQKYRQEGTIEYMRRHDAQTNLPNRIMYEEYTASFNGENITSLGILAVNINELSKINKSMGYDTGNKIIREMVSILNKIFTDSKIFRLSGDEFIVASENTAREVFEEKAAALKNAINSSGRLSAAIGYTWDDVEKDLGLMIWHSYELMKMNKRLYYDDNGNKTLDPARYEMLSKLTTSIENGNFIVYFQPKSDILENRIIGAEALIRYRENDGKISVPSEFLGRIEEKGMIRYVDLFVFEEVCKLLEKRKKEGKSGLRISVNFSRITLFESEVMMSIEAVINKYDVDRKDIEIEITESVSEMGKDVLCRIARDIKNAGFSISLDDFGTKYTNLSTLADIPFDMLKLDKSLINTLADSNTNRIIVKNIITMCRELGTEAIAEGVETEKQEEMLINLGCRYVQGYLYGKPMPANIFEKMVNK